MNAVVRVARDVSEEREMLLPAMTMGNWTLDLTVRYTVAYQSAWHRGRGIDPDITILSVTFEDGIDDNGIKRTPMPMLPGLRDAILLEIEADELQD
jgi:hypothetical protein